MTRADRKALCHKCWGRGSKLTSSGTAPPFQIISASWRLVGMVGVVATMGNFVKRPQRFMAIRCSALSLILLLFVLFVLVLGDRYSPKVLPLDHQPRFGLRHVHRLGLVERRTLLQQAHSGCFKSLGCRG